MATRYSDQYADLTADATAETENLGPRNTPSGNRFQRHMKTARVRYTLNGDEAAGDVIRLFKLSKGCMIIPELSRLFTLLDAGASMTVDVGDEDAEAPSPWVDSDADRYADGLDAGAEGVDVFASGAASTQRYTLASQCWITATLATLSTPSDEGVIDFEIVYLEPGPAEDYVA